MLSDITSNLHLFSLCTGDYLTNDFMIRPDTGVVLIAQPLDMEKTSFYNLTIKITDGVNTIYTQLLINIRDVNDHRPQFSQRVYQANVSENAPIDTQVIHLSATDKDEDRRLVYAIHSWFVFI